MDQNQQIYQNYLDGLHDEQIQHKMEYEEYRREREQERKEQRNKKDRIEDIHNMMIQRMEMMIMFILHKICIHNKGVMIFHWFRTRGITGILREIIIIIIFIINHEITIQIQIRIKGEHQ